MQKKLKNNILFSAMRPTGELHLGHWLGVIKDWVVYQNQHECYFMIADWHALMTEYKNCDLVKRSVLTNLALWIAAGVDPNRSIVFCQSDVPEHLDLYAIFSMITPLSWLERCPTYKEQLKELKNKEIRTHAFLGYPLLQTVDIVLYGAKYVPVGSDQLPHLELGREIIRRFHHLFQENIFVEPEQCVQKDFGRFLGIDGRKMSKSYDNHIPLSASSQETCQRIQKMKTDVSRILLTDSGHPEQCSVFDYHKIFNQKHLPVIRDWCVGAKKGCRDCKSFLSTSLNGQLSEMREKYQDLMQDKKTLQEILKEGAKKARMKAKKTLVKVRRLLQMNESSW